MIESICWVLIHSLWQGVLLALAGGGVILCTRRLAAAVRYRLLCGLLFFFVTVVVLTFFYEWGLVTGGGKGNVESAIIGASMNWLADLCSTHAGKIVAVWLLVAVLKSLRLAAGWGYMRSIRRDGTAATALWVERVGSLSRRLGIRRTVKLVESGLVKVPMVMGQLRPIIFIPLGLINHLPAGEMEAVVLHELAHIRRYDALVNIAQQIVECLLFFNPGLLWVSALIREERENCCDDVAIGETRNRVEFVRALVRFKEHSLRQMGLAFPGNKRRLLHRVLRLSRQENKGLNWREGIVLLTGGLLLLMLFWIKSGGVVVRPVEALAAKAKIAPAPKELVAVLQARQKVSENMEWVEAQLAEIHKKQEGKRDAVQKVGKVRDGAGQVDRKITGDKKQSMLRDREMRLEQSERSLELVMRNDEQMRKNEEQARKNEGQVDQNKGQAEQDRLQADRDRAQHERDVKQNEQDQQQAERDRQQAERDLEQAKRDREQADRDRAQADRDREAADREKAKADLARKQGDLDRSREELGVKTEQDRQRAARERQGTAKN